MIDRYTRPQMRALWSEEAKFRTWLDVEVYACEGWAALGKIPPDALETIQKKADFDLDAILEREKATRHDVAAFVSIVQERIGPAGRFLHLGLTSSDIVDTAFAYRMVQSSKLILAELDRCLTIAQKRALAEKEQIVIGRTHGIHAEPTTMGTKWLLWYDALKRARRRLESAVDEIAVGKLSGAVGNYAHTPPEVEAYVCEKLGLRVDSLSTQVISRDRFAAHFSALGLMASVVEWIAVELRHLQRTEVGEVREGFSKGQKGSSAMPHKRNPISAENLTGLARLLRSYVIPAMEDCALWHERDISHSSVERVIGPDANTLADYMLARLGDLLEGLEIFPKAMERNLNLLQGVIYSQKVLIALIDKGWSRDRAYVLVQKVALEALDTETPMIELLSADTEVSKVLSRGELDVLFEPRQYLKHLDYLFSKVLDHESNPRNAHSRGKSKNPLRDGSSER